jgi:hypothetical protein
MSDTAQPAEPFENYDSLSGEEVVAKLDELSEEQLIAVKEHEEGRDQPRKTVIEAVDAKLFPEAEAEEADPPTDPAPEEPPPEPETSPEDSPASDPPVEASPEEPVEDAPTEASTGEPTEPEETPSDQDEETTSSEEVAPEDAAPEDPDDFSLLVQRAEELGVEGDLQSMSGDDLREKIAYAEAPAEEPSAEPFEDGSLRDQADKAASDPEIEDPAAPEMDEEYAEKRDDVDAAREQESPTSSSPDDQGQREAAAEAAAEPLRREVESTTAELPESSPQHAVSSAAAEAGEQWPPEEPSADDLVAERDADTAEAEQEAEEQAKQAASDLEGDDALVAQAKSTAPPELDLLEEEPQGSEPQSSTFQIGDRASRIDRAHDEIGVIIHRHEPITGGLVDVEFPDVGVQTLNTCNLRNEGNPQTEEIKKRAYALSEERAF